MLVFAISGTLFMLAAGFVAVGLRTLDSADRHAVGARERFVAAFGTRQLPAGLLVQTYETLSRRAAPRAWDIRPGDRLAEVLGMSALDVEDVALLVVARCEGRIPTARDLDRLDARVRTVEDLVEFLVPFCDTASATRVKRA